MNDGKWFDAMRKSATTPPQGRIKNSVEHPKMEYFCKNNSQLLTVNYFRKKLHRRYSTGF